MAPITFTNGLRVPTQPSASSSALTFSYNYSITDASTYQVYTSLHITASTAFATREDQLHNVYQTCVNITGTRAYTYLPSLPNATTLTTQVVGLAVTSHPQRFYPYTLLSSSPGVYSANTAPFLDAAGLSFSLASAVPYPGAPPAPADTNAPTTTVITVAVALPTSATATEVVLTEAPTATTAHAPVKALQTQSYALCHERGR